LAIIPKAGHASNMEQPEPFNGHVRRFCRLTTGPRRASLKRVVG